MDALKQLEGRIQSLIQQRNQLREEVQNFGGNLAGRDQEIQSLRKRVEDGEAEKDALLKEREAARLQVEAILKQLENLG